MRLPRDKHTETKTRSEGTHIQMSSNIYENFSMDGTHCRGQLGGDQEERIVDIYDSVGTSTQCHARPETGSALAANQRPPPDVQKKLLQAAVVVLVLLCVLLGVGLVVQLAGRVSLLPGDLRYKELEARCQRVLKNRTGGNTSEWSAFQRSCYYKSTEKRNWTESREDCRSRGADLVMITSPEEQGFVSSLSKPGTFWIGLKAMSSQRTEWTWEWEWVDKSTISYQAWGVGVSVNDLFEKTRGYIGPEGTWNRTDGGSKHFICEKEKMKNRCK